MFRKTTDFMKCEICKRLKARFYSADDDANWFVTCDKCMNDCRYWINISDYIRNITHGPDWSWEEHLEKKSWFIRGKFEAMLKRERELESLT